MAKVEGRCWPVDVPFNNVIGQDGQPYVRDGFVCTELPGDFQFYDDNFKPTRDSTQACELSYQCPRTGQHCGSIRVHLTNKTPRVWIWDGNFEKPTITPSINCGNCGWHGYLQAGSFVDA